VVSQQYSQVIRFWIASHYLIERIRRFFEADEELSVAWFDDDPQRCVPLSRKLWIGAVQNGVVPRVARQAHTDDGIVEDSRSPDE
jgi:hypothetical protein